jgi:hypothetical protein
MFNIPPINISPNVQEPLDHRRIFCHTAHVEDILSIILVREVNIIEKEREVFEEPLCQMKMDGSAL